LRQLQHGQLEAVPQPEAGVNYAAKISKEEAALDFSLSATELDRKIRAFNPFPGAHASVNGVHIKLWGAEVLPASSKAEPGQILAADAQHGIVVACGSGTLRLTSLQKPGGKRRRRLHQGLPARRPEAARNSACRARAKPGRSAHPRMFVMLSR
jgi:methionyl-tRNA formyltransferase